MSRETKVGMLTGLLLIVIVGVLLSNYLGNNEGVPGPKLAAVDNAGAPARRAIQDPAVAPGLRHETMTNSMVAVPEVGKPEVPQPMAKDGAGPIIMPPTNVAIIEKVPDAVAVNDRANSVDLAGPLPGRTEPISFVTPEEARRAKAIEDKAKLTDTKLAETKVATPTTKTETYVVAKGDTLTIIAKKFYKSATKADFAKIVAANSSMLKDEKTQLVVGKKLTIPDVKIAAPVAPVVPAPSDRMIAYPGPVTKTPEKLAEKAPEKISDKTVEKSIPASMKTYVVQKGDTLERIARKFGSNTSAMTKALMTANGLKADTVLKVGQKLKVPDQAPTPGIPMIAGM